MKKVREDNPVICHRNNVGHITTLSNVSWGGGTVQNNLNTDVCFFFVDSKFFPNKRCRKCDLLYFCQFFVAFKFFEIRVAAM